MAVRRPHRIYALDVAGRWTLNRIYRYRFINNQRKNDTAFQVRDLPGKESQGTSPGPLNPLYSSLTGLASVTKSGQSAASAESERDHACTVRMTRPYWSSSPHRQPRRDRRLRAQQQHHHPGTRAMPGSYDSATPALQTKDQASSRYSRRRAGPRRRRRPARPEARPTRPPKPNPNPMNATSVPLPAGQSRRLRAG